MQAKQNQSSIDLSHLLHNFQQHKTDLDQQIKQFRDLQQQVQHLMNHSKKSHRAAEKLASLQQLEQSEEYIQLREMTLAKLQQLEMQFAQLEKQINMVSGPQARH